ncbi:TPA: ead/Ea22-like family protein [Klebsiella pneumoniae]|uniref:ead/Ea22-like family protein n=1 Tax=Klebsiella pneumoniae TaxID=573 RepID=UPI00158A114F|nr:ead/Ea22-like family protein [Klebsiella pneumoniae]QQO26070.1 ead/Ea22-like family protein [Klebsiella michiganensis]MBZ1703955.1 ead/Ea22-like family protein [Klebsiella pneumoniae]HBQ1252971.1 ead/Ea22-like family protein [Klebsiella pneumoniae]HBV3371091.1 ead/Ea22-like family protein [Klebsiella pneumoniae]HCD2376215.1 ead/Ea22-like family protein [Klebsiella pneumoniae]
MTTDITELAQRMKAAAEKATPGPWYVHDKPCEDGNYGIDTSDKEFLAETVVWWGFARQSIWREEDAKYIALANPANILALVEALEKAQTINAAAEKLVRCKGRYHSEQNYRALAALFGVNIPDLPPLEHENVHYADTAEMEIETLRQRIAEMEREQEHLRPVGVMSEQAFHRLENRECRFIALWPRPGIFLPRKRPEDGVIVYARTAAAAGIKVEAD